MLLETRSNNKEIKRRIYNKNNELQKIEYQNRVLEDEKRTLVADLGTKRMATDELLNRLNTLQIENSKLNSNTNVIKGEKIKLAQRLQESQDAINEINAEKLSKNKKEMKIKALKEEIRTYLKMGLR